MRQMRLTQSGAPGSSIQYMKFVEVFNVALDLSAIYFSQFSGCLVVALS